MRDRVVLELESIGLSASVQTGVVCGKFGICAEVQNIVAIVPGRTPRLQTALSAHYDSVPAGPGVADDGHGVAILLEAARALLAQAPEQSVLLIFTDGEELGSLGARLFAREHPLRKGLELVMATASIERYLRWLGEPVDPPTLAPARDPPYFKSQVIRRRLGQPAQAELFDAH
jgi:Zn-dependent M28 family amino/carboxypeptidase